MTQEELTRYSRQMTSAGIGPAGQARLHAGRILCIGTGGLGSPAALYLAAAGIGTLGLVDFDEVELTNLQRQVLFSTADVGQAKLAAARRRLEELNPHVHIELFPERLGVDNARRIIDAFDLVIDGSDNFPTRYLVNDACVLAGKRNVYGSIFRFEGQVSVFAAPGGPCYRCLHPEPPPAGVIPSCAEGGVLGVLPGVIGSIQATEALKIILGQGEPLVGRLLLYDALRMRCREVRLPRDPECPSCGVSPTITDLKAYTEYCDDRGSPDAPHAEEDLTVGELKSLMDAGAAPLLVDVREPVEFEICRLPGARLVPLGELPDRARELPRDGRIVVLCKSGGRSARGVRLLRQLGFRHVRALSGGILRWIADVDPSMPRY